MAELEMQNQMEHDENKDNDTNIKFDIDDIVIEWRDPKTADEINKAMYEKWKEIIGATPWWKKFIQESEKLMDKIIAKEKRKKKKNNNKKEVGNN